MTQSAGVIVVDWKEPEPLVLCVRAYRNWDFPKGIVEKGESLVQAASRELMEETELSVGPDVRLSGVSAPSVTYGSGSKKKTATYFLADRVSEKQPFLPVNPELGKPENDEYRWVPVSSLESLMPVRLIPVITFIEGWAERDQEEARA